jgi:hypothetical protein
MLNEEAAREIQAQLGYITRPQDHTLISINLTEVNAKDPATAITTSVPEPEGDGQNSNQAVRYATAEQALIETAGISLKFQI